jgi:hypothetical protein
LTLEARDREIERGCYDFLEIGRDGRVPAVWISGGGMGERSDEHTLSADFGLDKVIGYPASHREDVAAVLPHVGALHDRQGRLKDPHCRFEMSFAIGEHRRRGPAL